MAHQRDDPAMIVRHRAHGADEIRDAAELAFRRFVAGRVEGNHGEPRVVSGETNRLLRGGPRIPTSGTPAPRARTRRARSRSERSFCRQRVSSSRIRGGVPAQARIARPINLSHAALPERIEDLEAAQTCPRLQGHGFAPAILCPPRGRQGAPEEVLFLEEETGPALTDRSSRPGCVSRE